jgi:hypothetical protein
MAYYLLPDGIKKEKGFITHEDNELAQITEYPGNIFVTENSTWASRVGAIEKTKEEAQALVDAALVGEIYPEDDEHAGKQVVCILP